MEDEMAENSLSQVASTVNENTPIHIEFITENTPAVRSDILAEHFNRSHKNVLRDIAKLRAKCPESFFRLNFEPIEIEVKVGFGVRKDRAFFLTRDAFSLLVMGFTGSAAIRWKLRYIEAFNALEAAALENRAASLAELARESGYLQGLDEGRASVLPRLREERGRAAQLALSFTPARKAQLRKALRYAGMGLTNREIARLLGSSHTTVNTLIKQGRELGLVREEQRQCGLPGVTA